MEPQSQLQDTLIDWITENSRLMRDLERVRDLELPDCWIAAGYIRNLAWDRLHGFEYRCSHSDIDVVYFDTSDTRRSRDEEMERRLRESTGNPLWSVKNQARMHIRNGDEPYTSVHDALSRWPETATAVGANLAADGRIRIIAPYGLGDLFGLLVRRSPLFEDPAYYRDRVRKKSWAAQWQNLIFLEI